MKRYQVVEGSQSCSCFFVATVVDMTKPIMSGGEHYENQYEAVCECFDIESAEMVCKSLNQKEEK